MSDLLLVADSFRVRTDPAGGPAMVRGWSLHLRRFEGAVRAACRTGDTTAPDATELDAFIADAAARISAFGDGFPRLELRGGRGRGPELGLALRPLPELGETLEMRTAREVVLDHPDRKGPNIAGLSELNRALGAEALLVDAGGDAIEGATTSLIWWSEDGRGHIVADRRRVPSVTERLIEGAAGGFVRSDVAAAGLASHEVWAVNSLHGIRSVTSIDGVAAPAPDRERLERFRAALDRAWEPVRFSARRAR